MNKRVASLVLVSAMGVGGVTSLAVSPALAAESTGAVSHRLSDLTNALKGLVSDGTLTQAQADKVATTLDRALPHGGPGVHGMRGGGRHLDEAATALGMTEAEIRTALDGGASLADLAASKGISKATLVDKLVDAAEARIAAGVKAGRITQAHADEHLATLKARITELMDRKGLPARPNDPMSGSST